MFFTAIALVTVGVFILFYFILFNLVITPAPLFLFFTGFPQTPENGEFTQDAADELCRNGASHAFSLDGDCYRCTVSHFAELVSCLATP